MSVNRALLVGLVACYRSTQPAAPPPPTPPAETTAPRVREPYRVQPAELGDPGVLARIRHHARLGRRGPARLRLDAPTYSGELGGRSPAIEPFFDPRIVGVIGETRDALRVVSDLDGARLAVWVDRADALPTLLAASELTDERGRADAAHGVWLDPGVTVSVGRCAGDRVEVSLVDPYLQATGWIRTSAIGTVWVGAVPGEPTTPDPVRMPGFETIRDRPALDGRALAKTKQVVNVRRLATRGGWVEIELRRPGMRVVGFVPAAAFEGEIGNWGMIGRGSGTGYGMSGALYFDVPAGACLYDLDRDEVVGVNTEPRERYGHRGAGDAFARVYVNTHWGVARVRVRDVAAPGAPQPQWESCLAPGS